MYNNKEELNILIKTDDGAGYTYIHSFTEGEQDGFCHSTMYNNLIKDDTLNNHSTVSKVRELLGVDDVIESKERTFLTIVNSALKEYNVNETVKELPDTLLVKDINEAIKYLNSSDFTFILFQTK